MPPSKGALFTRLGVICLVGFGSGLCRACPAICLPTMSVEGECEGGDGPPRLVLCFLWAPGHLLSESRCAKALKRHPGPGLTKTVSRVMKTELWEAFLVGRLGWPKYLILPGIFFVSILCQI